MDDFLYNDYSLLIFFWLIHLEILLLLIGSIDGY